MAKYNKCHIWFIFALHLSRIKSIFSPSDNTSSPLYPQSIASAERMVQTIENILKKCDEEGEDPSLGLLSYRTTPVSTNLKSPAELLNNSKFRTKLPMSKRVSVCKTTRKTKEELFQWQKLQAFYYNKTAGLTLQPLQPGQPINIYHNHTQRWERGTVVRPAKEPRSFIVQNDRTEGVYRLTRSQLKPRPEVRDDGTKETPPTAPETAAVPQDSSASSPQDGQAYTTRSGRISKNPRQTRHLNAWVLELCLTKSPEIFQVHETIA